MGEGISCGLTLALGSGVTDNKGATYKDGDLVCWGNSKGHTDLGPHTPGPYKQGKSYQRTNQSINQSINLLAITLCCLKTHSFLIRSNPTPIVFCIPAPAIDVPLTLSYPPLLCPARPTLSYLSSLCGSVGCMCNLCC